jgi:DNA-binding MarR family transcriptional regulator
MNIDKEIEILESIYHNPHRVSQRDLAQIAGLSLGMTNVILKRLAGKGLLTIKKVNNRNIRYAVSPKGIEAITRKSYRYFKRTIKNVVFYRESIETLMARIRERDYTGLILVGQSDLDFMVEHLAGKAGLTLHKQDPPPEERVFTLYSESYLPDQEETAEREDVVFLQDLLM